MKERRIFMTRVLGIKALMEKIPDAQDEIAALAKEMGVLISTNIMGNLGMRKNANEQISVKRRQLAEKYDEFLAMADENTFLSTDNDQDLISDMRGLVFEYMGL
jgi:predicted metalloenzyme YecM